MVFLYSDKQDEVAIIKVYIVRNAQFSCEPFDCFFYLQHDKNLCYRRGTARCAMLVNSCHVSRAMGVIKVSNGKSDLQGYSRALANNDFLLY